MNKLFNNISNYFAVFALVLGVVFGFAPQTTLAQTWVNDVQVLKVAKNGEFSYTNATNEYVNSGDFVYVQVYFRAGTSINDAYIRLNGGSGTSTSHTISGGVYSSAGNSLGQVQISGSQAFSLNPIGARIYKNDGYGNRNEIDISGNTSQITNGSGYQLGALNQNINTQGALVVKYQVIGQYQNNNYYNNNNYYSYQCNDGLDNDGDTFRDQSDPDCHTDRNPNNASSYVSTYNENNYDRYYTNNNYNQTSYPTVITNKPTYVTETSARLNSSASANGSDSVTWYEWGKTVNMQNNTNTQSIGYGNNVAVGETITGLDLGTVYFYRAAVRNAQGVTRYGGVESFKTLGTPVVVQPTVRTVVQTVYRNVPTTTTTQTNLVANNLVPGLVALRVNDISQNGLQNQIACVGEEFNYEITYQNVSGKTLTNSVLEIRIPTELDYVKSTNGGTYSNNDRSLVYNLGTLTPNQSGKFYVTTKALSLAKGKGSVVTSLSLSYTNPTTTAQEEAIAYVIHTFGDCSVNNNAALALFGGSFLPQTLAGWLLLIILILAMLLLARTVYERTRKPRAAVAPAPDNIPHY